MSYPPTPPPNNRLNTTPQVTNHPDDHNRLSDNISDIVNELGSNPSGDSATLESRLDQMMPVGTILEFGASSPPTGNWLLCDGSSRSTTGQFAALFAVIGYNFGGAGSSFLLPNFSERSSIGSISGAAIGETGGTTEVRAHDHSMPHSHTVDEHKHSYSSDITDNVTRRSSGAPVGDTSSALRVVVSNNNQFFENGRMSSSSTVWAPMAASPSGQGNHIPAISTRLSINWGKTTVSGNTDPVELTTNEPDVNKTEVTGNENNNYHPYLKVNKIIKY
jgi:microcystin-dependent protein